MSVSFQTKNGFCPCYGDYYIQDRKSGYDQYHNDRYEYALFKKEKRELVKRFKKRKKAYEYLSALTGYTEYSIIYNDSRVRLDKRKRVLSVIDKERSFIYWLYLDRGELFKKPYNDNQLSVWFESYADCLQYAKEYIENKKRNINK